MYKNLAITVAALLLFVGCGSDTSETNQPRNEAPIPAQMSVSIKNQVVTLDWPVDTSFEKYHVYYSAEHDMDVKNYRSYSMGTWLQDVKPPLEVRLVDPTPIYHFYLTAVKNGKESLPSNPVIAAPRYLIDDLNSGQVIDLANKLVWDRCVYGQVWSVSLNTCTGQGMRMGHNDTISLISDGMRLPTLEEFSSLFYCRNDSPPYFAKAQINNTSASGCKNVDVALDPRVFPNTPTSANYRTSSDYFDFGSNSWMTRSVNVRSGSWGISSTRSLNSLYFKLVRDYEPVD